MLTEEEWLRISDLICDLYQERDLSELVKKIMTYLRMLVPYTVGYCVLLDDDHSVRKDKSYVIGMKKDAWNLYLNEYYDKDYLQMMYDITRDTRVYRDTDILDDSIRTNTEFYKKFLEPLDIPYGCGILLAKGHKLIGIINLFRNASMGDFSEKDVFILDVLKKHFRNMFINSSAFENLVSDSKWEQFGFTPRETEIVKLAMKGHTNDEICDKLVISESTVKKHFYSIYNKAGVHSRVKLLQVLHDKR